MSNDQTFRDALSAIQARDWKKLQSLATSDFQFLGGPMPMNMEAFTAVQGAIEAAMPDFTFHVDKIEGAGDNLTCELHVTATHTAPLSLPVPGMPTVPATNKKLNVKDSLEVTIHNGKVARVESVAPADAGMGALLRAIGVPV